MPIRIWNRTGGKGPVKRETASSQTEKAGQENHDRQKTENKPKSHKPTVRNILVLGKTGVGKTSLLNYLYGFDLRSCFLRETRLLTKPSALILKAALTTLFLAPAEST